MSHLRGLVNDQLFVPAGRRIVPPPRAIELHGRARSVLEELNGILTQPAVPIGKLERTFNLRTTDGFAGIWARLLERVRREAPHVSLCFHPHVEGVEALRDRSVDLEITVLKETGPEVFKQRLFSDHYVGVAAANHPFFAAGAVTAERRGNRDAGLPVGPRGGRGVKPAGGRAPFNRDAGEGNSRVAGV